MSRPMRNELRRVVGWRTAADSRGNRNRIAIRRSLAGWHWPAQHTVIMVLRDAMHHVSVNG